MIQDVESESGPVFRSAEDHQDRLCQGHTLNGQNQQSLALPGHVSSHAAFRRCTAQTQPTMIAFPLKLSPQNRLPDHIPSEVIRSCGNSIILNAAIPPVAQSACLHSPTGKFGFSDWQEYFLGGSSESHILFSFWLLYRINRFHYIRFPPLRLYDFSVIPNYFGLKFGRP